MISMLQLFLDHRNYFHTFTPRWPRSLAYFNAVSIFSKHNKEEMSVTLQRELLKNLGK